MLIRPVLMICPLVRANYVWMCHGGGPCDCYYSGRADDVRQSQTAGVLSTSTSAQQVVHSI